MLSSDPDSDLTRVRSICLALPGTAEKTSHGIPAFHVAGKMFAYFRHDHHGNGNTSVCVRTSGRDEQEMLIGANSVRFSWPAYIGHAGWIAVCLADADDEAWEAAERRVRASYEFASARRPSKRE